MEFPRGVRVGVEYCVCVVVYVCNEPKAIVSTSCDQVSNFGHFVCLRKGV